MTVARSRVPRDSRDGAPTHLLGTASPGAPLKASIYEQIRSDILNATLRPGDLLVERRLAERFHVSKTPVREALAQLHQEGLVEVIPRKGYFVSKISLDEVHSIFHLRQLLEAEGAFLAARRASPDEIKQLESLVKRLETLEARGVKGDSARAEYRALNRDFHVSIARASRNRLLAEFVERLMVAMDRVLTLDILTTRNPAQLSVGHREMVEAIKAADEDRARQLMIEHIEETKRRILQHL